MAKQEVTGVQVQMAAAAGVKLLQIDDLPVPMVISKSGALSILEGLLSALANGELVLAPPPPASPQVAAAVGAVLQPPAIPAKPPVEENNGGGGVDAAVAPVASEEAPAKEA